MSDPIPGKEDMTTLLGETFSDTFDCYLGSSWRSSTRPIEISGRMIDQLAVSYLSKLACRRIRPHERNTVELHSENHKIASNYEDDALRN